MYRAQRANIPLWQGDLVVENRRDTESEIEQLNKLSIALPLFPLSPLPLSLLRSLSHRAPRSLEMKNGPT